MKREPPRADPFLYDPRMRRVARFVERHITEPISLAGAAEVAALEPKYFSRYFHKRVGTPFTRWLAEQRVQRSTELLTTGHTSIAEIARDTGFSHIRTFERRFKAKMGVSPSEFRNQSRK